MHAFLKNWGPRLLLIAAAWFGSQAGADQLDPETLDELGISPTEIVLALTALAAVVAGRVEPTQAWQTAAAFLARLRVGSALTFDEQREQFARIVAIDERGKTSAAPPPPAPAPPPVESV